jgi:hypothetical protein
MDRDAILALARAAQSAQTQLDTFVTECFEHALDPAGTPGRAPVLLRPGLAVAGRPASDLRGQIARTSPYPGPPAAPPPPLSADFYVALDGGVLRNDVNRTRQAMRDFLQAVREVWSPTPVRIIGLLLNQSVLVVGDRDLIAYRVHFGSLISEIWGLPREELARQALRAEKAQSTAHRCQLITSVAMVTVAVIVCVIAVIAATGASSPQLVIMVVAATDAVLVTAVVILLNGSIALIDIARALASVYGITGERLGRISCLACKSAGLVAGAALDVLVSVLKHEVYAQGLQAQAAYRRIAQDLLTISVQLDAIVAALRHLQASEDDLSKALKGLQGVAASDIARALKNAGSSFEAIARALKNADFSTDDLAGALASAFGWSKNVVRACGAAWDSDNRRRVPRRSRSHPTAWLGHHRI